MATTSSRILSFEGGVLRYSITTGSMPAWRISASVLRDVPHAGLWKMVTLIGPCPPCRDSAGCSCGCLVPVLAFVDDANDQQHCRHLDQNADDGRQGRARLESEQADGCGDGE